MNEAHLSGANASRFDDIARSWDDDPKRVMAQAIAEAMLEATQPAGSEHALEIGAGTGLVTALLAPHVGEVLAVDSSAGMLEILEARRAELQLGNVRTARYDLAQALPRGPFDLIFSSMTLHHVADVAGLFARLAWLLAPGGRVALADLDREDGSFHGTDAPGVAHLGFERATVRDWLVAAGLGEVVFRTAHVARRTGPEHQSRDYPIFLVTARRTA